MKESAALRETGGFLKDMNGKDKTFAIAVCGIIGVYAVKRFFDSIDKAMDSGYAFYLKVDNFGEMTFAKDADADDHTKMGIWPMPGRDGA